MKKKLKVLLDELTIQVFAHHEQEYFTEYGLKKPNPNFLYRLTDFYSILESLSDQIEIKHQAGKISSENLHNIDCLIILTRYAPFSQEELRIITDFLAKPSHSLLFMSNHDPDNIDDKGLGQLLEVELVGGYFSKTRGEYTYIRNNFLLDHPIVSGTDDGTYEKISKIVTNTMCRLVSKRGIPFAEIPETVRGAWGSKDEPEIFHKVFGIAIDGQQEENYAHKGKMVIVADSGWSADSGSVFPGYGVMSLGDNRKLLKNILRYLLLD